MVSVKIQSGLEDAISARKARGGDGKRGGSAGSRQRGIPLGGLPSAVVL